MSYKVTDMSVGIMSRTRRKARQGRLHAPATSFTLRHELGARDTLVRDTRVPYPVGVAVRVREINREEWSRVILELLETEANGNRTALARLIGVDYQTIRRWISGTHKVSEENVRTVARAFKLNTTELLVRVGYYQAEEIAAPPEAAEPAAGDRVMSMVKAAKLRPSVKRELYQLISERREQSERQLAAEIERLIAAELRVHRSA